MRPSYPAKSGTSPAVVVLHGVPHHTEQEDGGEASWTAPSTGCEEVVVNWNRKIVPMEEDDLDRSRQMTCLAVHGTSAGTSKRDLETTFPDSVSVIIGRRGGPAFLQLRDRERVERTFREFRRGDRVVVRGCRVVFIYSHTLMGSGSYREGLRGILSQKRGKTRRR